MSDILHPDGKCSCYGEGRCDFCRRCHAEIERDDAMERVVKLEAALETARDEREGYRQHLLAARLVIKQKDYERARLKDILNSLGDDSHER